jgi:hypothetical protein
LADVAAAQAAVVTLSREGIPSRFARKAARQVAYAAAYAAQAAHADPDGEVAWHTAFSNQHGVQASILREIFGSPFRPVLLPPSLPAWNDGLVVNLATAIYEGRSLPSGHLDAERLMVLADAIEECGCTDASLLEHLRGPGPHYRGCFAVDLLLGRDA